MTEVLPDLEVAELPGGVEVRDAAPEVIAGARVAGRVAGGGRVVEQTGRRVRHRAEQQRPQANAAAACGFGAAAAGRGTLA